MNMTASQRIRAVIKGEKFDRLPVIEWAPWWNLTAENWIKQGLPLDATKSVYDLQHHFGLDKCIQTHFFCKGSRNSLSNFLRCGLC